MTAGKQHVNAIFQGRRYRVVARSTYAVWLEPFSRRTERMYVVTPHPDLILDPTSADLELAEAFERGEIEAFEYPDGHTFPPDREIPRKSPPDRSTTMN